jgi:hypothetical protein
MSGSHLSENQMASFNVSNTNGDAQWLSRWELA